MLPEALSRDVTGWHPSGRNGVPTPASAARLAGVPFTDVVETEAELRALFRPPGQPALRKQIDHIDDHCRSFLAHTPFVIIATADPSGRCDASPKGGPPGFVRALDDHRVAIPDLSGNNRLDTMQNLIGNPGIALLCCIPGVDETLRING